MYIYNCSTVTPSYAGSSSFQVHLTFFLWNPLMISAAISSKFSVAKARIVGPAPDRQIPNSPGYAVGVTLFRISVRPGIKVFLYGW